MRKEKRLAKALITLFVEDEQKKLCDKYHDLKLSYNRKTKLLRMVVNYVKNLTPEQKVNNFRLWKLAERIENEINFPYHRKNWGFYKRNIQPVVQEQTTM